MPITPLVELSYSRSNCLQNIYSLNDQTGGYSSFVYTAGNNHPRYGIVITAFTYDKNLNTTMLIAVKL